MVLDNFRSQKIIWDRANKQIFDKIEANSGDSNGRKLVVQVINQEVTESLSGTTLSLGWKARNGAKGLDAFNFVDASKGIFEIYYTTEMLSNIGNIEASLILIDSTGRIESSTFTISIRPSTVDDESVESENSFTALTEALGKVNDFSTQLAHKRDKTAKISRTDMDISSDSAKLGLINLSEEVQSAMAGTAPVLASVEDKSITATKYADESVPSTALSQEYNFRGIQVGIDANTLTKSGLYFLTAASPNLPVAASIMLYVQRYGSRFTQIARRYDNPTISWVRGGDLTNISNLSWRTDIGANSVLTSHIAPKAINNTLIADNSVGANNLMDGYDYVGFYFGADKNANDLTKSGLYYVAASVLNLPKRNYFGLEAVGVIMKVEKYNTRIIQTARPINYPNEVYYRYTETTFEGVPWINQQRESKPLYGKNVILMGDSLTDKGKQHLTIWEKTGAEVDKIGIGGTTMSNHGNSPDYSKLSFYSLAKAISTGVYTEQETAVANIYTASSGLTDLNAWLTKFKAIDWNTVNYILVRYGTNDHAMNNQIGIIERTNFDTSTYIGAFNQGVKDILTAYPHIRIFVATPLWRYSPNIGVGGDSDIAPNNNGDYLVDFVDSLETASGFNHLPYRDYYRHSGINAYTDAHYLSDQTHLNDAGSILIGEIDSNFLTSN